MNELTINFKKDEAKALHRLLKKQSDLSDILLRLSHEVQTYLYKNSTLEEIEELDK